MFGYQKGADNEKKSINNFHVYHLFNNKKSQINNKKYNISTIFPVKKLTEQPYQLPILYFKNENIGNDIKIDRINNKDIYYANGILITELSDCITDYYKNVQEFKRSNKMIYSYSLNLIFSWKNGFFNKDIYKYTFISPKILYKDNLDNIIVKEIPATYLNKSIADTMIKGDVDNVHSNNHYIYNFFNFTFDYSQNNKPKIIIEPVNEFMSYEDLINL